MRWTISLYSTADFSNPPSRMRGPNKNNVLSRFPFQAPGMQGGCLRGPSRRLGRTSTERLRDPLS